MTPDVVVVGAGAVGSAVAYYLASAGASVVLLDREGVASGASTHATGSFSLLGADFQSEPHLRLGVLSDRLTRALIPELEARTGMRTLYQRRPSLRLALDEDEERAIRERPDWHERLVPARWIDASDVRHIEPRVCPAARGAMYEAESAQVDSGRLTLALATAAERLGTTLLLRRVTGLRRTGDRVSAVSFEGGEVACGQVVLAMGLWAAEAQDWLNVPIPVTRVWGERLLLDFPQEPLPVLISSPRRGHMISRLDGLLSVGSTAGRDFDDPLAQQNDASQMWLAKPTEAALIELMRRALDVVPAVENASVVQQLAGYRPWSPDRLPLIGELADDPNVYLATGHGTKGIHLAAATGKIVRDLVLDHTSDFKEVEVFSPARFANGTSELAPTPRPLIVDD
jgi:glycine oxidase